MAHDEEGHQWTEALNSSTSLNQNAPSNRNSHFSTSSSSSSGKQQTNVHKVEASGSIGLSVLHINNINNNNDDDDDSALMSTAAHPDTMPLVPEATVRRIRGAWRRRGEEHDEHGASSNDDDDDNGITLASVSAGLFVGALLCFTNM